MDILVTGVTGIVGTEVWDRLRRLDERHHISGVSRQGGPEQAHVRWDMSRQPVPAELRRHWDVIIHTAASTRWTMNRSEAMAANVEPTRAVLRLADSGTHVVHVSTAFVEKTSSNHSSNVFDGYRNGYEWSKALCERVVRDTAPGPATIIRPPLVLGRTTDGAIARFSGPYTIARAIVSGLAAVLVGDAAGFTEIAPVDQVAEVIVDIATSTPAHERRTGVIAAGERSLRLDEMSYLMTDTLNRWRSSNDLEPIPEPPIVSTEAWHRFHLPLAREYLSPVQHQAVELLGMFEAYTSLAEPFAPDWEVRDPASTLVRSITYWASARPQLAARVPEPWARVVAP